MIRDNKIRINIVHRVAVLKLLKNKNLGINMYSTNNANITKNKYEYITIPDLEILLSPDVGTRCIEDATLTSPLSYNDNPTIIVSDIYKKKHLSKKKDTICLK